MSKHNHKALWINILSLLTVFLMMAAAAILRDGRLLGHDLKTHGQDTEKTATVTENADGTVTVNTTGLSADYIGYAGPVPVEITLRDGKIEKVEALDNSETPAFFGNAVSSGLLDSWNGMTASEAAEAEVDAVTGATYSSTALIQNVRAGMRQYSNSGSGFSLPKHGLSYWLALAVALMAALLPLFFKNKKYIFVQQLLNIGVLGFLTGSFVDYTNVLNVMANGLSLGSSLVIIVLLLVAFFYPLFGHHGHYCAYVCPLGSLQEVAHDLVPARWQIKVTGRTAKVLTWVRTLLWAALMMCLWLGFFASWIDYELFIAFLTSEAPAGMLVAGGVVTVLSLFVRRPYCRFVCPTGCLLRISENTNNK